MRFEWNEAKSDKTLLERGFDFNYAATVFEDSGRIEGFNRTSEGEARYWSLGRAAYGEILYIVYTWRQHGEEQICRIISARKASRKERKRYSSIR